jgi:homoserine kinase
MTPLRTAVKVTVPATSANLGPGFDALGMALNLYDEVTVEPTSGGTRVWVTGEGAGRVPTDETHLIIRSMNATFAALGVPRPGLDLRCVNRIPHARGLGSSSAAIVAGVLAARTLAGASDDRAEALRMAYELEGHPDNVAPCLLGGIAVAWVEESGARAVRLTPHSSVRPVMFVSTEPGLTAEARAVLPANVTHADAAFNVGRSALLVHALTMDPGLLFPATADRLHQGYRAEVTPETARLLAYLRVRGIPATVSGAGPSVLAFISGTSDIYDIFGQNFIVRPLKIDLAGAQIFHERHAGGDPVAVARQR